LTGFNFSNFFIDWVKSPFHRITGRLAGCFSKRAWRRKTICA
jgi:hypothetical protein